MLPIERRGASGLSPWIRHGLLTLPRVAASFTGRSEDRRKFHDELRWQEYARHLYARLGRSTGRPLRRIPLSEHEPTPSAPLAPWDRTMRCIDANVEELDRDGWMVNQARMWLASHWSVRAGFSPCP